MLLPRLLGGAATTSWPPWRRMATVFEPIRPVPPITTIFIPNLLVRSPQAGVCDGCAASRRQRVWSTTRETESVLFHSRGLSVTTRRSSQIHPSLSAPRAPTRKAEVQAEERYHWQSRLACCVGRRAFCETGMTVKGNLRGTSPSCPLL